MSNEKVICNDLEALHPYVKQQVLKIQADCKAQGINVTIFETIRTQDRQKYLVQTGMSQTLNSYHCLGLAADFVPLTDSGAPTWNMPEETWNTIGNTIQKYGLYSLWINKHWDGPHGQLNIPGVPVAKLYDTLNGQGIQALWETLVNPYLESVGLWHLEPLVRVVMTAVTNPSSVTTPAPPPPARVIAQVVVDKPTTTWYDKVMSGLFGSFGGGK